MDVKDCTRGVLIHSLWMCWVVNFGGDIIERMAYTSQPHIVKVLFSFFNPQIDNYMYYTGFSNPGNNRHMHLSAKKMNYCSRVICFNVKPRCKLNNFKHSYVFRNLLFIYVKYIILFLQVFCSFPSHLALLHIICTCIIIASITIILFYNTIIKITRQVLTQVTHM